MLQRDNLFRRREEPIFRPIAPSPAVAAVIAERAIAAVPPVIAEAARTCVAPPAVKPGEGSKMIVGPEVKLKAVEITDCDTLVVEANGTLAAAKNLRVSVDAGSVNVEGGNGTDVKYAFRSHDSRSEEKARRDFDSYHLNTMFATRLTLQQSGRVGGHIDSQGNFPFRFLATWSW